MAKVPHRQFFCVNVHVNVWISDRLTWRGQALEELWLGSLHAGTSWALTRNFNYHHFLLFVLQQSHLKVSKNAFRLSVCVLSNTERQKPTDWRRAEQRGGEKEGPGRKMLLVTRSLLCPHCQILATSPA